MSYAGPERRTEPRQRGDLHDSLRPLTEQEAKELDLEWPIEPAMSVAKTVKHGGPIETCPDPNCIALLADVRA